MLPKVTIIIPYNKDRGWLNEAIESVNNQSYRGEIELILSQSNNGVSHNLNQGIKQATGDYIKYLCDDDRLTVNSILDSVNAIQGYDFLHGRAVSFGDFNDVFTPPVINPNLNRMIIGNCMHGGSLMYHCSVFDRFGLFDETLTTGEEYDFNLKLLKGGAKLAYCNEILYEYRRHAEQKSLGHGVNQGLRQQQIKQIRLRYV